MHFPLIVTIRFKIKIKNISKLSLTKEMMPLLSPLLSAFGCFYWGTYAFRSIGRSFARLAALGISYP
jgi:hypothetical protein